jgi:hypothetical protein
LVYASVPLRVVVAAGAARLALFAQAAPLVVVAQSQRGG